MSLFQSLAVQAALKGKAIACGSLVPADEDVLVVTGLSAIDYCIAGVSGAPATTHSTSEAAKHATAGTIQITSWEADGTVATVLVEVTWIAIGDP